MEFDDTSSPPVSAPHPTPTPEGRGEVGLVRAEAHCTGVYGLPHTGLIASSKSAENIALLSLMPRSFLATAKVTKDSVSRFEAPWQCECVQRGTFC